VAIVATQNPGLAGITPTVATASGGGDRVAPGTRIHVINGGGAPINCTVTTPGTVRGNAIADTVIACPNGAVPTGLKTFDLPTGDFYTDPADGLVGLAWSATTSVTFWVEGPVLS
jgi:hypothetical protein